MLEVLGVIPARYKSSRFPGKPLAEILGKPMVIWVAEAASAALGKEHVVIATDDEQIHASSVRFGFQAIMTSDACQTGTDRVSEVAEKIDAGFYINIQGDEPLVDPRAIAKVHQSNRLYPGSIINCMSRIPPDEDPANRNLIKVVTAEDGRLMYMSRSVIPGGKTPSPQDEYYKQVCIYGFTREQLTAFSALKRKSRVEAREDIEILRFLDLGFSVQMLEVEGGFSYGVDEPGDISIVEQRLRARG
ncbi:MAG: 3-deoxy-manno-octulosonate cytidylyltransferase [Solirubrobacterales bacterium]